MERSCGLSRGSIFVVVLLIIGTSGILSLHIMKGVS